MSSSLVGWTCSRCTFYHHLPGTRCAMCNELRTNKAQMREFILGKKIVTEKDKKNSNPVLCPSATTRESKNVDCSGGATDDGVTYDEKEKAASAEEIIQNEQAASNFASQQGKTHREVAVDLCVGAGTSHQEASSIRNKAKALANPYAKAGEAAKAQPKSSMSSQQKQGETVDTMVPPMAQRSNTSNVPKQHGKEQCLAVKPANRIIPPALSRPTVTPSFQVCPKPTTFALCSEYMPGPVPLNPSTSSDWIFPIHPEYPVRKYQLEIAGTAVKNNTLVSLPTGLGKTLIAAVVVYNYYRWFPSGKVLFLAPTLPLVNQQVQACYKIMGIPPGETAVLTGRTPSSKRVSVWQSKRVFFCTPQTVQKDLEQNVLEATKVVCVVLDEAHKASGDYAYVKVVEKLREAGAKFRVTGLSATPGSDIKSIQQVVDALHINKIEARQDSDPDVVPYIHERTSEIVIVKASAATKPVLYALNDIIGPLLERLRSGGAFGPRFSGNATLTAYNIWIAKDLYEKRCKENNSDKPLTGLFLAANKMAALRDDLHKHGLGVVRMKVLRHKNEPQRGYMASIVKGKEFHALWEAIVNATSEPGPTQTIFSDRRLENNPKLAKLREILIEHFERAKVCSSITASTRAIVFSQFRDSVSEIVSVLEASKPLIRPRHFVGQGKGASKGEAGRADQKGRGMQLCGMKQAEQHEAIRQFRADVYNVLVCTCIGEEGLDIGQVDLIVNFDTLRSPIRMIQRTGRTGRQRAGRVVCLVSEGQEERTLAASRQSERKLGHALKNPMTFKVSPTVPLFPSEPSLCKSNMLVSPNFRPSQVEGHQKQRVKMTSSASAAANKRQWRLSEIEEAEREAVVGKREDIPALDEKTVSSCIFPIMLRRRLLLARSYSAAVASSLEAAKKMPLGITTSLLRTAEKSHSPTDVRTVRPRRQKRSFRSCEESALHILFPVASRGAAEEALCAKRTASFSRGNPTVTSDPPADVALGLKQILSTNAASLQAGKEQRCPQNAGDNTRTRGAALERSISSTTHEATFPSKTLNCDDREKRNNRPRKLSGNSNARPGSPIKVSETCDPTRSCSKDCVVGQGVVEQLAVSGPSLKNFTRQNQQSTTLARRSAAAPATEDYVEHKSKRRQQQKSSIEKHNNDEKILEPANGRDAAGDLRSAIEEFRLPTQSDLSSSSEDETEDNIVNQEKAMKPPDDQATKSYEVLVEFGGECDDNDEIRYDEFRLPTPEPSSSEEDSELADEEGSKNRDFPSSVSAHGGNHPKGFPRVESRITDNVSKSELTLQECRGAFSAAAAEQPPNRVERLCSAGPLGTGSEEGTPRLEIRRRKRKVLAVDDSPSSTGAPETQTAEGNPCIDLEDTQPDDIHAHETCVDLQDTQPEEQPKPASYADDTVCAICFAGESPDEDPIILCDGPGNGNRCDLAVHWSCYSATVNLNSDDEWRCDTCQFRLKGGDLSVVQCFICHGSNGVLKEYGPNKWKHVRCPSFEGGEVDETRRRTKRLRRRRDKVTDKKASAAIISRRRPLSAIQANEEIAKDASASKCRRQLHHRYQEYGRRFLDEEAEVDSGDDMDGDDGEEEDIAAIEEQEALEDSFINDSSQLGFSPNDELAQADPDSSFNNDDVYRTVDQERERITQFATPIFNRRMQNQKNGTPVSAPESERGLGGMHFIRSVLEHHRQGGRAEEIEALYDRLDKEENAD